MITFRPLEDLDFERMHRWLNEPGVVEWWEGDDVSPDGVRRLYFTHRKPDVEHWLALDDGEPFGWIQCYPVSADPVECDAWFAHGIPKTTAGIDYLIGEVGKRGTGRGSAMIDRFTEDVVFALHPAWTHVGAGPFSANRRSCGALAKAGFVHVGTIADADGPLSLMLRGRPDEPMPDPSDAG